MRRGGRKSEVNVLAGKAIRKRNNVSKHDVSKHADLEMSRSRAQSRESRGKMWLCLDWRTRKRKSVGGTAKLVSQEQHVLG